MKEATHYATKGNKENKNPCNALPMPQPSTLDLDECLQLIAINKDSPFELDAFVHVPSGILGSDEVHGRANAIRDRLASASEYQWK